MIKKIIIVIALLLTLGVSSIVYAKANNIGYNKVDGQEFEENERKNRFSRNSMFDMMEQYGYGDLIQDMREGNYEAMDEFMNNLSDEDYENMIDIMEENGYWNMARMMKGIGREEMVDMHNYRGRSRGCHY